MAVRGDNILDSDTPICLTPTRDRLGEGPCWSPAEGRLYWFDIKGWALNVLEPATGAHVRHDLPWRASAAAVRRTGGLLVATERGLAHWDAGRATLDLIQPMAFAAGFRTNDGKIDPRGDFWWSTMDDDHGRRPGAIYRTDGAGVTAEVLSGIHIANTVSFSADGAWW